MQKTIRAEILLPADTLASLIKQLPGSRYAEMVQRMGEACTKTQAAHAISCSTKTITNMLEDGRLLPACGGERVDVRSLCDYIENRGEADRETRMRKQGKTAYI